MLRFLRLKKHQILTDATLHGLEHAISVRLFRQTIQSVLFKEMVTGYKDLEPG